MSTDTSKKSRPRTRTFTACLTCRSRKVKCDLGRPACANCQRLKLTCSGYDAVLRWMPGWDPNRSSSKDQPGDGGARSAGDQGRKARTELLSADERRRELSRLLRHLPAAPSCDDISCLLDSLDDQIARREGTQEPLNGDTHMEVGPFTAFASSNKAPETVAQSSVPQVPDTTEAAAYPQLFATVDQQQQQQQQDLYAASSSAGYSPLGVAIDTSTIDTSSLDGSVLDGSVAGSLPSTGATAMPGMATSDQTTAYGFGDNGSNTWDIPIHTAGGQLVQHQKWNRSRTRPSTYDDLDLFQNHLASMSSPMSRLSGGAPYLPPDIRFLLNHYDNYVIDSLSCVPIPRDKAPWRHLHLPSALKAYGELDILGNSSLFRVSLLYTILALTCYNLSSLYNMPTNGMVPVDPTAVDSPDAQYWAKQASRYRAIGRTAFRKQMESQSAGDELFEEALLAAMTLVCVGIVSGEPWDARLYILQCDALIRKAKRNGRYSADRVKELFNILGFVKTLEQSTFVYSQAEYAQVLEEYGFLPSEVQLVKQATTEQDQSVEWNANVSDAGSSGNGSPPEYRPTLAEFRPSMAPPENPLDMVRITNELVDRIGTRASRSGYPRLEILPQDLADEAAELESCICNWKIDDVSAEMLTTADVASKDGLSPVKVELHEADGSMRSVSAMMTSHMRSAIYHAVLVYFFREVRHINPTILQHYIRSVVVSLENHQALKKTYYPMKRIGTIVWPAFVAACEALDAEMRYRAIQCVRYAADSGFRNGELAESVAREVWRRRDAGDLEASWRDVVRQNKLFMLLS